MPRGQAHQRLEQVLHLQILAGRDVGVVLYPNGNDISRVVDDLSVELHRYGNAVPSEEKNEVVVRLQVEAKIVDEDPDVGGGGFFIGEEPPLRGVELESAMEHLSDGDDVIDRVVEAGPNFVVFVIADTDAREHVPTLSDFSVLVRRAADFERARRSLLSVRGHGGQHTAQ